MNIANQERTTISTEGKEITFKCNSGTYYVPPFTEDERALMLESFGESFPFAILCTKVQNDRGSRPAERFGTPCMEDYDNGPVGWQNIAFFRDEKEAAEQFKLTKRLTPGIGTIGYCDILLFRK